MERRVIDMEKDPRREQFQLFSGYAFPYAGVTVQLDVTALELRLRAEHKPIFLTMLYVIHRAVNRVPELRRRIEDGQVVEYDECPVSFTEMKPDGSYAYCRMESARVPYEDYIAMGRAQQAAARQGGTIETDRRAESPSIFASCLPWLNYTSLTHPACTPAGQQRPGQLGAAVHALRHDPAVCIHPGPPRPGGWLAHRAVLPGPGGGDRRPVPHRRKSVKTI